MFIKKIKKITHSGFTLVELMVGVAVIGILSTMSLVNFRGYSQKNQVDLAAYKLASDIRAVQNYALSMKEFGGDVPKGGWGFRVSSDNSDNDEYIIYADLQDISENWRGKYGNGIELFQTIDLPEGVLISQVSLGGNNRKYGYINNLPPNPDIVINSASQESNGNFQDEDVSEITITLSGAGSYTRKVKANKFGLVDVE